MTPKSFLSTVGLLFALLVFSHSAIAQTTFRPGREGGEFSGYEEYRALLDRMGLLHAEPEPWRPLPQARAIMDELAANGDLQDDFLTGSWAEIERIAAAIEAAWPDCEVRGVEAINRQLRILAERGEQIHARWAEVAEIRDGVVQLYRADMVIFLENVGNAPDVRRVALDAQHRSATNRFLAAFSEYLGGRGAALRTGAIRFLGALSAIYLTGEGAVMSYEAFRGYQRLPHILEKYEMISYLNGLTLQYREIVGTINTLRAHVRERLRQDCPCLPERMIPAGQVLDLHPDSAETRLRTLQRERHELRARAQSGGNVDGYRLAEVERQIDELFRRITSRSDRNDARTAWYEQITDNSEARERYRQYTRLRAQAEDRANALRHQQEYEAERVRGDAYRRQRERR